MVLVHVLGRGVWFWVWLGLIEGRPCGFLEIYTRAFSSTAIRAIEKGGLRHIKIAMQVCGATAMEIFLLGFYLM